MEYGLINRKNQKSMVLKAVDISGDLAGNALWVKIRQHYHNDSGENAEFIYTFPMPENAAVCDFIATIGEKVITTEIKEKEEAFAAYDEAIRQGDSAFLLESMRVNVFQISLGQIDVGEDVKIEINYFQEITTSDTEMRLLIPTLVGARYIPGNVSGEKIGPGEARPTDRVPDADFITPPRGNTDYRASLQMNIKTLSPFISIDSPSHRIQVEQSDPTTAAVSLEGGTTRMNRDFILSLKLSDEPLPRILYSQNDRSEYYALASYTPEFPPIDRKQAGEYIFLIDISGSMAGEKLEQAAQAMKICLRNLGTNDLFNLVAFESGLHPFSPGSLPFNQKNLDSATRWVSRLRSMGGTEILPAVKFALNKETPGYEKIILLFTDGQVGNENEIIKYTKARNKNLRLFSIGIDTTVNDFFINRIAEAGNGYAEFVYPGENLEDKVIRHFSRIHASYMENITIQMEGLSLEPGGKIPNRLYDMEPFTQVFKMNSQPQDKMIIKGYSGTQEIVLEIDEILETPNAEALEKLWAKRKITELETYLQSGNPRRAKTIEADIIELSQKHHLLSSLTSFVGVYQRENKLSGLPELIVIPVDIPYGWDMFAIDSVSYDCITVNECLSSTISGALLSPTRSTSRARFKAKRMYRQDSVDIADTPQLDADIQESKVKQLAAGQNADGSFGSITGERPAIIEETVQAIIYILESAGSINLFRNQLLKAFRFLMTQEETIREDKDLLGLVNQVLQMSRIDRIICIGEQDVKDFVDRIKAELS
ncbi:MAG TPA: VWA domain-containing protein [Gelria sp.]|jgi:Ca-activated chloride channel family protein|nr:VWA domain-containing protein [Gelria sp.]